jgi:hypothetical protein
MPGIASLHGQAPGSNFKVPCTFVFTIPCRRFGIKKLYDRVVCQWETLFAFPLLLDTRTDIFSLLSVLELMLFNKVLINSPSSSSLLHNSIGEAKEQPI